MLRAQRVRGGCLSRFWRARTTWSASVMIGDGRRSTRRCGMASPRLGFSPTARLGSPCRGRAIPLIRARRPGRFALPFRPARRVVRREHEREFAPVPPERMVACQDDRSADQKGTRNSAIFLRPSRAAGGSSMKLWSVLIRPSARWCSGSPPPAATAPRAGAREADRRVAVLGGGHPQQEPLLRRGEDQRPWITPESAAAARNRTSSSWGLLTASVLRSRSAWRRSGRHEGS